MSVLHCSSGQVLAEELADLKRQRAEMRANNRALAVHEKNLKKRRARLLQARLCVNRPSHQATLCLCFGMSCSAQAARQLSQDDLVLLLQRPEGQFLASSVGEA